MLPASAALFAVLRALLPASAPQPRPSLWAATERCRVTVPLGIMASPAPEEAAVGHGPGGSGGAEETLDFAAGRKRQPPLSAQSAFSFIPTSREGPPELSYFNRKAKTGDISTYDAIFKRQEGYNKHLHRSDRQHAKSRGLNIIEEEMARPVAVLSSSEHGKRINKPLEQPVKTHARINHVKADFYRRNGIICLTERPCPSLDPC